MVVSLADDVTPIAVIQRDPNFTMDCLYQQRVSLDNHFFLVLNYVPDRLELAPSALLQHCQQQYPMSPMATKDGTNHQSRNIHQWAQHIFHEVEDSLVPRWLQLILFQSQNHDHLETQLALFEAHQFGWSNASLLTNLVWLNQSLLTNLRR